MEAVFYFDRQYLEAAFLCRHLEAVFEIAAATEAAFSALEAVFSCQNLEAGQHSWQHLEVAFLAGLWPHFEAGLGAALEAAFLQLECHLEADFSALEAVF